MKKNLIPVKISTKVWYILSPLLKINFFYLLL